MIKKFIKYPDICNLTLPVNVDGRDFIVGDIHGEGQLLSRHLQRVGFDVNKDRLISCGDIIDRGKDNEDCLALLNEPWFYAVLGNHEHLFINSHQSIEASLLHHANGGLWTKSYADKKLNEFRTLIIEKMPLSITLVTNSGNLGIIHGSAPEDWQNLNTTLAHTEKLDYLWARSQYNQAKLGHYNKIKNIELTVHGHVNCEQLSNFGNQIWLDTLYRGNDLTVIAASELFDMYAQSKNKKEQK